MEFLDAFALSVIHAGPMVPLHALRDSCADALRNFTKLVKAVTLATKITAARPPSEIQIRILIVYAAGCHQDVISTKERFSVIAL